MSAFSASSYCTDESRVWTLDCTALMAGSMEPEAVIQDIWMVIHSKEC